ncbi:hypothetical protein ZEAMMB73_Zm00001d012713 [Zea mays]|uniref:Secreted protein n=1 Tax=Zea mays TaxID=4577 RepID=A0A1D6GBC3_MAIZE|nr:hypothetical protein ZEAMMB73_Zm00001d012713 [Zea mays]AQL00388.1 hypothetical protein ZEAMMB73_Zm00001d012713 [Zea mays]
MILVVLQRTWLPLCRLSLPLQLPLTCRHSLSPTIFYVLSGLTNHGRHASLTIFLKANCRARLSIKREKSYRTRITHHTHQEHTSCLRRTAHT